MTGAHRSGTTWVGRMLAADDGCAYISEPLNMLHRPGVFRAPVAYWYQYICKENEDQFLPAFQETLKFQYHTWLEIKSLRSAKDVGRLMRDWRTFTRASAHVEHLLIKDPFAVFSAPWFADRLNCQVVITVRHPAAFVSSLKRLDWPFEFDHLLSQPLLMRDWLEPFRKEMRELLTTKEDIFGSAALLWRMIYYVVDVYHEENAAFQVVRHEDLSVDPVNGFRQLYKNLGLQFTPDIQQTIVQSSSSSNPQERSRRAVYETRLDSRANIENWKRRLTTTEIARIRTLTADISSFYYEDKDWE
ncbi:MAG: sulfotransferase domain-containing protein [Chloroflexota bacterium]|nr:sulfotransferase domain-containing protein [Chloroflexota bacterium]